MAFDPIQEDCHRLVLEALRRDNIPLTDGAAVERLMEQFTRNPAPLIVHDRAFYQRYRQIHGRCE